MSKRDFGALSIPAHLLATKEFCEKGVTLLSCAPADQVPTHSPRPMATQTALTKASAYRTNGMGKRVLWRNEEAGR